MNLYRSTILLFIVALVLIIFVETNKPKTIDWSESFSGQHKRPRGAWIMHDLLGHLFPDQPVTTLDKTLYGEVHDDGTALEPVGTIVMINRALDLSETDTETLLEFVAGGGHALLAAESFHGPLADTLGVETDGETMGMPDLAGVNDSIRVTFASPHLKPTRPYLLPYSRSVHRFVAFDGEIATVIETMVEDADSAMMSGEESGGENGDKQSDQQSDGIDAADTSAPDTITRDATTPDTTRRDTTTADLLVTAIRVDWGEGEIILSTLPHSYTNYVLLTEAGLERATKIFSYLPIGPIYWDEYNKPVAFERAGEARRGEALGLDYILSRPPLRMAWYALLALGALFVLFGARRRQRVIPVVRPPANTTVEFVETLGRLYHQTGSFKSIATKRIASLHDHIRTGLHLSTHRIDDELIVRIAERSGVDRTRVATLMELARRVERSIEINGAQLLELSDAIEYFYRHSQR